MSGQIIVPLSDVNPGDIPPLDDVSELKASYDNSMDNPDISEDGELEEPASLHESRVVARLLPSTASTATTGLYILTLLVVVATYFA